MVSNSLLMVNASEFSSQGVFNEKQYCDKADILIDELADILHDEFTVNH